MAANVLLEIATKTDFASLAALKDMVLGTVGAIREWVSVNENFVRQMDNATISISGFDKNVANLIDTGLAYQKTTELTNAGLEATKEEYAAVAKAATIFGQTTGDVNGEFSKLIEALKTGRTEGLKRYGVEIERTGDRQKDFEKAVAQLNAKFADQKVELQTLGQVTDSISNNWGTFTGQIFKLSGAGGTLAKAFEGVNKELQETTEHLDRIIQAMDKSPEIKKAFDSAQSSAFAAAMTAGVSARGGAYTGMGQTALDEHRRAMQMVNDLEAQERAAEDTEAMFDRLDKTLGRLTGQEEFSKYTAFSLNEGKKKKKLSAADKKRLEEERRRKNRLGADAASRAMMMDFNEADILRQMAQEEADAAAAELKELNEQITGTQQERMERQEAARIAASDYANAIHEQNLALREQTDIAYQWAMSWEDSFSTFNTGAFAAEMGADFLRGSIEAVVMSIWNGSDNVGQALLKFTQQLLLHGGIQILGEGFVTLARAIGHAATPYTAWMAPKEFVASGVQMAMGTAMVSGAFLTRKMSGAGGKDQSQSGASSAGSSQAYSDGSPTYLSRKQDEQRVNVTITLKDGADGFVSAMYSQNEQRAKRGATHFRSSEGY